MKPEMEALGRRAVRCRGWRFMRGVSVVDADNGDDGLVSCEDYHAEVAWDNCDGAPYRSSRRLLPDFSDAPTRGALLELVREAWADPDAYARPDLFARRQGGKVIDFQWVVWGTLTAVPAFLGGGATEVEALVAALEAAP